MTNKPGLKISWYRSPISREILAGLNQKDDGKGLIQSAGHLALLVFSGSAAWLAFESSQWVLLAIILYLHGSLFAFLINGLHELTHKTVFKTKLLNTIFVHIYGFLSWINPHLFWASHQEHHKYTLHPPYDQEVLLPQKVTPGGFLMAATFNIGNLAWLLKRNFRLCFGELDGAWENWLYPEEAVQERQQLITWARLHLIGHALILGVAVYYKLWLLPVIITLAPFYGGALQYLCNNTQHTGLMDQVPDYRLCCRTMTLHPFVSFLYWHMEYHTEHHMYAAVPCYNLPTLHHAIQADLPACPVGLVATWKGIIQILNMQKKDPNYQYRAELPSNSDI